MQRKAFALAGAPRPLRRGGAADAATPDIPARRKRLPLTPIAFDNALLDQRESRVVRKLIDASRLLDDVFLRQVSQENPALRDRLAAEARAGAPAATAALALFEIHTGRGTV